MRNTCRFSYPLIFLIALILFAIGCDKEVKRAIISSHVETQKVSCSKAGYCFTCLPGFDGKMKCGVKFSAFCPGRQDASVRVVQERITYESGKIFDIKREEIISRQGSCQ